MSEVGTVQGYRSGIAPAPHGENLADILERVLDKGIVIAGDIKIQLLDIELLTIKIRLLIASADKAAELGITWWQNDPFLTGNDGDRAELEDRVKRLEAAVQGNGASDPALSGAAEPAAQRE
jgi:hypothetical protein